MLPTTFPEMCCVTLLILKKLPIEGGHLIYD